MPNYMTGAQGTQMAPMPTSRGLDVNDQGMTIGMDKRIYDKAALESLVDALNRIGAQELATAPRDFRPNPPAPTYPMPNPGGLYGVEEGTPISF